MPARGYDVVPRVMRTEFVDAWQGRLGEAAEQAERLRGEVMATIRERRPHELTPFTGQAAGLVGDVAPAGEIVRRMADEARDALRAAGAHVGLTA